MNRQAWIDYYQSSEVVRPPNRRAPRAALSEMIKRQQSYLINKLHTNTWTLLPYIKEAKEPEKKVTKKKKKCEDPGSGSRQGSSRALGSSLAPSLGNVTKVSFLLRRISFLLTRHTLFATSSWSFSVFRVGRKKDAILSETKQKP